MVCYVSCIANLVIGRFVPDLAKIDGGTFIAEFKNENSCCYHFDDADVVWYHCFVRVVGRKLAWITLMRLCAAAIVDLFEDVFVKMEEKGKLYMKTFLGNCVVGLEDPVFQDKVASDATEMAQLVEHGREMSLSEFIQICDVDELSLKVWRKSANRYQFFINAVHGVAWVYDTNKDVHDFYV